MIAAIPFRALAVAAVLGVSFLAGWRVQGYRCVAAAEKAQAQALAATISAYEADRKAAARESYALEHKLAEMDRRNRTLTRRLTDETRKDAYRCPLPADGLGLFNASRAGTDPGDSAREPDR